MFRVTTATRAREAGGVAIETYRGEGGGRLGLGHIVAVEEDGAPVWKGEGEGEGERERFTMQNATGGCSQQWIIVDHHLLSHQGAATLHIRVYASHRMPSIVEGGFLFLPRGEPPLLNEQAN